MSKRESTDLKLEGHSIFIRDLQEMGYIPEGILNWIALMGASFDEKEDIFTLPDFIQRFRMDKLNPSPAAINFEKADHFNGVHLRRLPTDKLAARLHPVLEKTGVSPGEDRLLKVAGVVQERIITLDDVIPMGGFFFRETIEYPSNLLIGKGMTAAASADLLVEAASLLETQKDASMVILEQNLRTLSETRGLKPAVLFGMLRAAVTGQSVSPPLFASMEIIGMETVRERVRQAIAMLQKM